MHCFQIESGHAQGLGNAIWPCPGWTPPTKGFLWLALGRDELAQHSADVQALLNRLAGVQLLDLHISDLLNAQLPSRYDYTSQYDVLVFRQLRATPANLVTSAVHDTAKLVLRPIETEAVGFVLCDSLLLSIHPSQCPLLESFSQRLNATQVQAGGAESRSLGSRGIANNPADMMLRMVNHIVDGFLALRRDLSQQLDHWQAQLLNPKSRFANWSGLLQARRTLHQLEDGCEDQNNAVQEWLDTLKSWSDDNSLLSSSERDLLQVRSRDVLEHIDRVAHHVRQLEQAAESAVQIHFNAQSHRTNEIMRTLTVLTAIFLPLNLIAAIFGMNFDFIPLLHRSDGFWLTVGLMALTATTLVAFFWRKRYLTRSTK